MGGSTSVPINKRMAVWLETVPALLQELHITHVSFMTHSAGAIYTLNTLLHHRGYLDPENPKVAFLGTFQECEYSNAQSDIVPAPYVPMGISNATLPILLSKLPDGVINSFGGLNEFINDKVMASASWSGGLLSSTTSLFSSSTGSDDSGTNSSTSTTSAERFGVDEQTAKAIDRLSVKYKFAEDTSGINDEARLCLQKCADGDWGEAHDYADCIKSILRNEHTLTQQHPERPKLKVAAYFSGSDVMIGKRGEEYFKQCWQQSNWQEMIDFSTQTFPKANHDTVLIDYKKGALPDVFARVANSS